MFGDIRTMKPCNSGVCPVAYIQTCPPTPKNKPNKLQRNSCCPNLIGRLVVYPMMLVSRMMLEPSRPNKLMASLMTNATLPYTLNMLSGCMVLSLCVEGLVNLILSPKIVNFKILTPVM
jgi:hypothetical protein